MSGHDIVLNWNDSLLYSSDLNLLSDGEWLNDRLIGFVYEYMEKETYKYEASKIAFVNPSTVQCLKLCSSLEEADICFLSPLELNQKDYVFFPINNNQNSEVAGGSHWSLLCWDKNKRNFIHLDSIGSNREVANFFFKKFKNYFGANNLIENVSKFPKQENSCDCGMYVLVATEVITEHLINNNYELNESNLDFTKVTPRYIKDSRKRYKDLIIFLSN